jgi:hypothetical protein
VEQLNDVIVDVALAEDPQAREWWKSHFIKKVRKIGDGCNGDSKQT